MVSGDKIIRLELPGLTDFMGEELPIPAQEYCVHLSTRVDLHHHRFGPVHGS